MALFIFISFQLLLQVKSQANLSTASTTDTTLVSIALAVTSSAEIITDPITNMSSLTHDSQRLTSPANASLESTTLTETTEHASVVSIALAVTSSAEIITDPITNMSSLTHDSQRLTSPANASLESTTLTETTEHASGKKYSNKKMLYFIAVVATSGGIVLTGLMGICLYGCTRRPKEERIWIGKKSKKQGVSLPIAGSDSSGEEDTAFYSTINSLQSISQPPGNSEESEQTEVELNNLYCTILAEPPVSSDTKDVYSLLTVH